MKCLYTENYKINQSKLKENQNKQRDVHRSQFGRHTVVQISIFCILIYGSNAIQGKITDFSPRIDKFLLKYTYKGKEPIIVKIL